MSEAFPKPLTDEVVRAADVVITMGCGDACPIYPGKKYEDWVLDDPAGQDVETVRRIRDEVDARVQKLIAELLPEDRVTTARRAHRRARRHLRARLRRLRRGHGRGKNRGARTRRRRDHVRPRDHGDDLRGRAHLGRAPQSRGQLRLCAQPALPLDEPRRLLGSAAGRRVRRGGDPPRIARQHRARRRDPPVRFRAPVVPLGARADRSS